MMVLSLLLFSISQSVSQTGPSYCSFMVWLKQAAVRPLHYTTNLSFLPFFPRFPPFPPTFSFSLILFILSLTLSLFRFDTMMAGWVDGWSRSSAAQRWNGLDGRADGCFVVDVVVTDGGGRLTGEVSTHTYKKGETG
ncbi:uncharacterized protein J3D65DRAFT_107566 [Phyllosticta citribraziliensis]|uniref:Secreted protein n=1 Tax=Phyllosticta citribraziliensis TaxID=989973 RepID=A0ABR1LB49_9PEZI